jgi:hypothetical protein
LRRVNPSRTGRERFRSSGSGFRPAHEYILFAINSIYLQQAPWKLVASQRPFSPGHTPLSAPLQGGLRFLPHPLPPAPSLPLARSIPGGNAWGLPSSVVRIIRRLRSHPWAERRMSIRGNAEKALPPPPEICPDNDPETVYCTFSIAPYPFPQASRLHSRFGRSRRDYPEWMGYLVHIPKFHKWRWKRHAML